MDQQVAQLDLAASFDLMVDLDQTTATGAWRTPLLAYRPAAPPRYSVDPPPPFRYDR